ncbi:MAG: putative DNA modification/repair radical SAM protein [Clostridia bacterium]|nr:putative DNA modification/repair radical SAM protein [Clostridia bacterium]
MLDGERLKILTESAKYDVSCSSSGSKRSGEGTLGDCSKGGICHSFTADGRCVSLLKILLTNKCCYDCLYCVNRRSVDAPRASATPDEICELTMNFYKRNYIEGLFLSSAVERSPDYTMERLLETVIKLRKQYGFGGYIHLKGVPGADRLLIERAGMYVDRMSFNIELPTENSLRLLAPQKSAKTIFAPMRQLSDDIYKDEPGKFRRGFLPAGQTTQMIVGASPEKDGHILRLTQGLYDKYKLKRVYFSSYVPTNFKTEYLPTTPVGLLREHRLYQADWLLRFYGFSAKEILDEDENLEVGYDPKCHWALKNPHRFPVEVNTADYEMLVRVPGIGIRSARRIVSARKYGKLDFEMLKRMRVVLKRAKHFITVGGKFFGNDDFRVIKNLLLLDSSSDNYTQLSLFSNDEISGSVLTGEV